jgi:tartrate dehydrogenase/decarboxylase/D-malate dehydrogenase
MMLQHLGEFDAAEAIMAAIESVLSNDKLRTRDLNGSASTEECGKAVADALA